MLAYFHPFLPSLFLQWVGGFGHRLSVTIDP